MKVGTTHLTYCTNVHPGETWPEVFQSLRTHVVEVKSLASPDEPMGVGLRLSAVAAQELSVPTALHALQQFLSAAGLYVFTLNGFPYGPFHGQPVKASVYRPDWQCAERATYTEQLVHILGELLPAGQSGSISTVPGAYRPEAASVADRKGIAQRLADQAVALSRYREKTGRQLSLALEPEPCCMLETTQEAIAYFEEYLLSREALTQTAHRSGCSVSQAEQSIRSHLGLCLDTCHAAIEFEDAADTLRDLKTAGLQVSKVQASTGLKLTPTADNLKALAAYDEAVYLHQVVAQTAEGELLRYLDLPQALQCPRARAAKQWRVHFHVPVHRENLGAFCNTQAFLVDILKAQRTDSITPHFEVETYTWDVLPPEQRLGSVTASIAQELAWVKTGLNS